MRLTPDSVVNQHQLRDKFWKPRSQRMEQWHLTYLLFDAHQQSKPLGRQRFVSNEPANIVDKAASAIAQHNNARFFIPMDTENDPGQRAVIAQIEDLSYGLVDEINESLVNRGASGDLGEIFAKQALLRGWVAGCEVLQPYDEKGFVWFDDWDPLFTFPDFGRFGLRSILNYSEDHLGSVLADHPWLENAFDDEEDMMQIVKKYIWYDEEYYGCVAYLPRRKRKHGANTQHFWISRDPDNDNAAGPYKHGLPDIPAFMIPVNGLNFRYAPDYRPDSFNPIIEQQDMRGRGRDGRYRYGSNHWVADRGRSIFANAENSFPQFNELVATVWQVVANDAYGTWVIKSRDGKMLELEIGNNAVNPLRLDETLEKINPSGMAPSMTDLLAISSRENERATFSFKLFGDDFQGSGFLFNQVQQGMANALYPFRAGVEKAYERIARIGTRQFRMGEYEDIELSGRKPMSRQIFTSTLSSMDIEKDYRIRCELQLNVPDDMLSKIQMARLLVDPRRPLASLQTVFDKILGWDDPDGEKLKIFEDIADTDPVIVLERTANALEQRGLPEIAETLRTKEFMMKAMQEMQKQQLEGSMAAMFQGQGAGAGADPRAGGQTSSPPNPTSNAPAPADMSATAPQGGGF